MASSYVEYTGPGPWAIPFPYLDQSHVHLFVNDTEVTEGLTWLSAGSLNLTTDPASDASILIRRQTPDEPLVSFTNRVAVNESNLNTATLQAIYRAVESADRSDQSIKTNNEGVYDFGGARATNVGSPEADSDLVTKSYADAAVQIAQTAAADATTAATGATEAISTVNDVKAEIETIAADAQAAATAAAANAAAVDPTNILHKDENLSGLTDLDTARSNLGVGDNWGNASTGHNSNNLNNLKTSGQYTGNLLTNAPNDDQDWWYIIVVRFYQNDNYCLQIASKMKDSTASNTYIRILNNDSWGSWQKIATAKATAADFISNVADRYLASDAVWSSAAEVTVDYASSIALDFSTFLNAKIIATGNFTLGTPTHVKSGQSGRIRIVPNDDYTLTLGSGWKGRDGATTFDLASGKDNILYYDVIGSTVRCSLAVF
jgi:hypothetical protein